jgi:hypothetical protein
MAEILFERWQPLSVEQVVSLFDGAPFTWGLAGGYASASVTPAADDG